jgi:hypothetical protein
MKARFKVIGANSTTAKLMGEEGVLINTYTPNGSTIREIIFCDESYFFDEKSVDFLPDTVIACGWLSDNKSKVGKISLKFIPENE